MTLPNHPNPRETQTNADMTRADMTPSECPVCKTQDKQRENNSRITFDCGFEVYRTDIGMWLHWQSDCRNATNVSIQLRHQLEQANALLDAHGMDTVSGRGLVERLTFALDYCDQVSNAFANEQIDHLWAKAQLTEDKDELTQARAERDALLKALKEANSTNFELITNRVQPDALLPAETIAKLKAFRDEWWKFMDEDTAYSDAEAGEELTTDILPRLSDFINTLTAIGPPRAAAAL